MKNEIEVAKKKSSELMSKYVEKHTKTVFDKIGNPIDTYVDVNPILISNTFFKSLVPIDANPDYSAQELAKLYQYYEYLLTEINDNIGDFPSSLTLFCKLIGISLKQFQEMRSSQDENLSNVVEKIYNDIEEFNISMAQLGKLKERITLFKLKSQNEMEEKVAPKVNINIKKEINENKIVGNIDAYSKFVKKYGDK